MEVSRGGEKKRKKKRGRERESDRPHALGFASARANPLVFGFSGKTARVKGRPVSNSRLSRGTVGCVARAGVAFSNPRPPPRPFSTPVTRSPSQRAGQVWPIFPKGEIKGEGREGFCARRREGTRLLYPLQQFVRNWQFATWRRRWRRTFDDSDVCRKKLKFI